MPGNLAAQFLEVAANLVAFQAGQAVQQFPGSRQLTRLFRRQQAEGASPLDGVAGVPLQHLGLAGRMRQLEELGREFDIDQAAAHRLTTACGGITPRNPQQIWEADDVDAVLIASSTDTHVDLLRQAMRAGKPTYCEKPIDLDIENVRMFVDEASACDPPLFIGFRRRFQPEFQSMHRQIRDGAIGQIESIRITARDFELASLAFLQRSGGLLRDKMIHYFDLAPWLAAERPTELYATGSCLIDPAVGQMGDVDTAVAVLRFPSGALCTIENGRRAVYGFDDRVEVFGAKGMLQGGSAPSENLVRFTAAGIMQSRFPDYYGQESFAYALDGFITALESGAAISPSLQDGYQAQLIAEAAIESMRTNQPVKLQWTR